MRISDWSSDVCSSDLITAAVRHQADQATQRLRQTFETQAEAIGNMADRTGERLDHMTASLGRQTAGVSQSLEAALHRPSSSLAKLLGANATRVAAPAARTRVVWGKSVSVRVDLWGRHII